MTKSGLFKDERDTVRRRQRHRDGKLLREGLGLTTGLGWSDSEDEDAPSLLTRRLISTNIARKPSASASAARPTHLARSTSVSHLSSRPPSAYSLPPSAGGPRALSRSLSTPFARLVRAGSSASGTQLSF